MKENQNSAATVMAWTPAGGALPLLLAEPVPPARWLLSLPQSLVVLLLVAVVVLPRVALVPQSGGAVMMVDTGEYPFGSPSPAPPPPAAAFPPGPHSYATLTPLQPLPPLNAIPEEFGFVSTDGYGASGNVSGSFTVMQANSLHAPYPYRGPPPPVPPPPPPHPPHAGGGGGYYDMGCEQQQHAQCYDYRDAYCPVQQDYYPVTVKTELHPHHYLREAGTPPSPGLHGQQQQQQHPPAQHTPPAQPPAQQQQQSPPPALAVTVKSEQQPLACHQSGPGHPGAHQPGHQPPHQVAPPPNPQPQQQQQQQQEAEEINTKELAQRISAELKRYSIPQAIFAQRILCRSQGTLSDLLRNPKPWSKLKSGRETFRRMWKWLQEPEYQRMSSLRHAAAQIPQRAACKRKLDLHHHAAHLPTPHDRLADRKQRLLFADLQRALLISCPLGY
ncbi:One cut domain family member 2 [Frankliniella fusca]|uniref:One cut domain family member 2 n=1 Tax=Frankliniella fusca TaxID=407009 RepID=A0AAE1GYK5_9NEOP|nr:One cut domain family member 2 [Frankliniella fusca]